jgi:phasin family protein
MNNVVKKSVAPRITEPVESAVAAGREAVETVVNAGREAAARSYEKAVAMGKEQVEAAVKAGAEAFKGYEDVVSFGRDNVDAVVRSGTIIAKGVQDINKVWLGLAQTSMEEGMNAAKSLLGCRTVKEVFELQGEYARTNYAKLVGETRRVTDMTVRLSEEATTPIANRVNAAIEKLTKPLTI